jgi:hypothetical protein
LPAAANGTHPPTALSVQNIIDCSTPEGNMGCRAGNMEMTYNCCELPVHRQGGRQLRIQAQQRRRHNLFVAAGLW